MRIIRAAALLLLAGLPASWTVPAVAAPGTPLRLLTWPDYIDDTLLRDFEAASGVHVRRPVYFGSDAERDRKIAESEGRGYDLAVVDGYQIRRYRKRHLLAPLPASDIPNQRHVAPRWQQFVADAAGYAIPLHWGTLGIAYRADLYPEGFPSWQNFFRPDARLCHHVYVIPDNRDTLAPALLALARPMDAGEPEVHDQLRSLLQAQRPCVAKYSWPAVSDDSALLSGAAWATTYYNGDAVFLRERNPNVRFVVPKEGGLLWADYLVVVSSSPRRAEAMAFINFMNDPANAARQSLHAHFATANAAAQPLLPEAFRRNPVIYPPEEELVRMSNYPELSPRVVRLRNQIFAQVIR